jgi:hypothetical protein
MLNTAALKLGRAVGLGPITGGRMRGSTVASWRSVVTLCNHDSEQVAFRLPMTFMILRRGPAGNCHGACSVDCPAKPSACPVAARRPAGRPPKSLPGGSGRGRTRT